MTYPRPDLMARYVDLEFRTGEAIEASMRGDASPDDVFALGEARGRVLREMNAAGAPLDLAVATEALAVVRAARKPASGR